MRKKKFRGISFGLAVVLLVSSLNLSVSAQGFKPGSVKEEVNQEATLLSDDNDELVSMEETSGEKTIVTSEAQFKAALADENVDIIEINGSISGIQGEKEGPLVISRPLTLQGGILNMRYLGIVLGADVTFKDIQVEFTSVETDAIVANGYTLTLENAKMVSTGEADWSIAVFCGGIEGYSYTNLPVTGSKGEVIIKGDTVVGDIYAGTLSHMNTTSSEYVGNSNIYIDTTATGKIGNIYGCGGRESMGEGTGNLIYSGSQYSVNGNIDITLYDNLVDEVVSYNENTAVTYRGSQYMRTLKLNNISSLVVESGNLRPSAESNFSVDEPMISVVNEGKLYVELLRAFTVGNFIGGGALVLGQEQKLTVEGNIDGSTKVYIGDVTPDFYSAQKPIEEFTYIEAKRAEEDNFVFQENSSYPGLVPTFNEDGNGGGAWITTEEYVDIIKVISATMEDLTYDPETETETVTYLTMPIIAEYTDDSTWWYLDGVELDVRINDKSVSVVMDEYGPTYQSEGIFFYLIEDCLIITNEAQNTIPDNGVYRFSITIPARYTESQTQPMVLEATLTIGEVKEEEALIEVEKPSVITGLIWNGSELTGVVDGEGYTLSGIFEATDAGEYTATATLKEGYVWSDGSSEALELHWSIGAKEIEEAKVNVTPTRYEYTGSEISINSDRVMVILEGVSLEYGTDYEIQCPEEMVEEGTYEIKIVGKGNYTGTATVTVEIYKKEIEEPEKISIEKPVAQTGLIWNTEEQTGVEEGEGYTLSGTYKATEAGSYTATATLKEGYVWSDGSSEAIELTWSIAAKDDLWIKGIEENGYEYTGKAIKPEIQVYDGMKLLIEKTDYTVSYKNNININNASRPEKAPVVIITGKGNYTGKVTTEFEIIPRDLEKAKEITVENICKKYNSKVQKPVPVVYDNGKKLKYKTHYLVEYPNVAEAGKEAYKDDGNYQIIIKGVGNYQGKTIATLTITKEKLMSQMTVVKIPNQIYTGDKLTPAPVVKDKKQTLEPGVHYEVRYENNKEIGKATAIITSKEGSGYTGEKIVYFQIKGTPMSKVKVQGLSDKTIYTGKEITLDSLNISPVLTLKNGTDIKTLTRWNKETGDGDYEVSYESHINKGVATIVFTGKNGFTGTLKKKITIKAFDVTNTTEEEFSIVPGEVLYTKGGSKPKPVVKFGEQVLKEGEDYTLSYRNNTKANDEKNHDKSPTVIVKGKGNFTGSKEKTFEIKQQDISNLEMQLSDKVFKNKKNSYKAMPKLIDSNGKALNAGTDYEQEIAYYYEYVPVTEAGESNGKEGEMVGKDDIVQPGTVIRAEVRGKGNYKGTISKCYRIVQFDISAAKADIAPKNYTGKEIFITKDMVKITYKGKELKPEEFTIEKHNNNKNKGTATVYVKGEGKFGGILKVSFKIKANELDK